MKQLEVLVMTKFIKKPVEVEVITFDELVEYGLQNGANIVSGMPWSFYYQGQPVTHENDECYIVCTHSGSQILTPKHVLIIDGDGRLFICEGEIFEQLYERYQQA